MAASTVSQICGYKYAFLRPVSEELKCVQCRYVARELHTTSCCKKPFCQACIAPVMRAKRPCPSCKLLKFAAEPNKREQKRILARKVRCPMSDRGCKWTGKLEFIEAHLDASTGDCEYTKAADPNQGCSTHSTRKYDPIPCPNRCGIKSIGTSNELDNHLKRCPLQEVGCDLSNAGCDAKVPRQFLERHMEENVHTHLAMVLATTLRTGAEFERRLQGLEIEFEEKLLEKDRQLRSVEEELRESRARVELLQEETRAREKQVEKLSRAIGIPPFHFSLDEFGKLKQDKASIGCLSLPMYTHPNGYRFQVRTWVNGRGSFTGTHVSVEFEPLRGDFDDKLKWPVRFVITLELLNQYKDRDHISVSETFEYSEPGRLVPSQYITHISHDSLAWDARRQTQYLKNEKLCFRIAEIDVYYDCARN
jgi:TNF receptor-associated factor 4